MRSPRGVKDPGLWGALGGTQHWPATTDPWFGDDLWTRAGGVRRVGGRVAQERLGLDALLSALTERPDPL